MDTKKIIVGSFVAFAFVLSVPAAVMAEPAAAPQAAPAQEYSDAEVQQFTQAYVQVEQIGQELNDALSEVQDPEQAREIQQEGYEKMHAAVQETGLAPETYNGIASSINTDEELRSRVVELLSQLQ